MPVNAGMQVRFGIKFKDRLDSGFRRNDGNKNRLRLINSERLSLEPIVVV